MVRHLENQHPEKNEEESDDNSEMEEEEEEGEEKRMKKNSLFSDEETEDDEEETEEKDDEDEDDDDDETKEEEEETEDDIEEEDYYLWEYLKNNARKDETFMELYHDTAERLKDDETDEPTLVNYQQAARVVNPIAVKKIMENYKDFLIMWHYAKKG